MKYLSIIVAVAALASAGALGAADFTYPSSRSFEPPLSDNPVGQKTSASRAFLGAPPLMPHDFSGERDDARACLECHARVTRAEKNQEAVYPVPHAEFSQCLQCHVNGSRVPATFRESTFLGLDEPGKGTRAFEGAPPTVPHKTVMRENCLSCHGKEGRQRIAVRHPFPNQCQQCHVSDASRNYTFPLAAIGTGRQTAK